MVLKEFRAKYLNSFMDWLYHNNININFGKNKYDSKDNPFIKYVEFFQYFYWSRSVHIWWKHSFKD